AVRKDSAAALEALDREADTLPTALATRVLPRASWSHGVDVSDRATVNRTTRTCEFMHRVQAPVHTVLVLTASAPANAVAQEAGHGEAAEEAAHGEFHLADLFWPVVNFPILCGVLYYFLKSPLLGYLSNRGDSIRRDLVEA